MSEQDHLLGVVLPPDTADYPAVIDQVTASLDAVRARLKVLRDEKEVNRREIKRLVGHEKILERMARIAETPDA